ncbi:Hypothetical predicted protein [Pelobates cultripes]|uniref:Uncharacterized protein n=1 Tax=Pelobates cultripes TaxID=61616 RepID=A0AAD1SAK6_PELCU|nr:Hypothetical predicted protein [Pelobates cultripes]
MKPLHYFHAKEEILKRSRTQSGWTEKYQGVAVYADIYDAFQAIMEPLRAHQVIYRWGYPVKLLVQREGKTTVLLTTEDGAQKLRDWGMEPTEQPRPAGAPRRLSPDWMRARRR